MKYLSLILWLMLYFVSNCHSQSINEVYCQPYKSTPTDIDGSALYVAKSDAPPVNLFFFRGIATCEQTLILSDTSFCTLVRSKKYFYYLKFHCDTKGKWQMKTVASFYAENPSGIGPRSAFEPAKYKILGEDRLHSLKADGTEEILTIQDRGNRPFVPQKKE